jgi:hypothetical protein
MSRFFNPWMNLGIIPAVRHLFMDTKTPSLISEPSRAETSGAGLLAAHPRYVQANDLTLADSAENLAVMLTTSAIVPMRKRGSSSSTSKRDMIRAIAGA